MSIQRAIVLSTFYLFNFLMGHSIDGFNVVAFLWNTFHVVLFNIRSIPKFHAHGKSLQLGEFPALFPLP